MEQKAAHTPAPWLIEWNAAQGGEGHYITDSKDMAELSRIAAVLFHDDADGETRANASLIAPRLSYWRRAAWLSRPSAMATT